MDLRAESVCADAPGSPMSMANKKARLMEWSVSFDQTASLRTLIDVVGNLLTSLSLRIHKSADCHQLCIDSIDPQHVCVVQARMMCESGNDLPSEDVEFCLDSSIFNTCLKSIPLHYSIRLSKRSNSDKIDLTAYECLSNSHTLTFELNTLNDDSTRPCLGDLDYDYTIEMDLGTLRNIIKMSSALKATEVQFAIRSSQCDDKRNSVLSISAKGEAKLQHDFHSSTVNDDNVIRAVTDTRLATPEDDTAMEEQYSDCFSEKYLGFFLKSMERQVITMKLSKDRPMLLHYPLGIERSYVCFVLAPRSSNSSD